MIDTARELPQSLESEQSTLGAQLIDRGAIATALDVITADDYHLAINRNVQNAIMAVDGRGEDVDVTTVFAELQARKQSDDTTLSYLFALIEGCPGAANVEAYAKRVREKSLRRRAVNLAYKIHSLAHDADTEEQLLEIAEREVLQLSERRSNESFVMLSDLVQEECRRVVAASEHQGKGTGIMTGFKALDGMTQGLQPSDLVIVAARPSMGKTAIALQIAHNVAALERRPAAVFSLEMSKQQLTQRLLSGQARINARLLRDGQLEDHEWDRLDRATETLSAAPLAVIDLPQITTFDIRSHCRRLVSQHGPLALVMVDYLQLVRTTEKHDGRVQEMSRIGKALKALAREMNCPVIALSQLSRAVEQREDKRPQLSDLRDSGTIEEDADIVSFIYREAYYRNKSKSDWGPSEIEDNTAEIIIAKHRNGPTGSFKLAFLPEFARFENLERGHVY